MNTQLISIVVPAYNIELYIARCLDSLLSQTYRNLEIIVVNDGSTDETGAIIDAYASRDSRVVAVHKENGGVSSARICGIHAAKGDYIGFVDGDDFAEPEMFSRLLKNMLEYNADISHCGYQMVFPDGHVDMYYNTGKKLVQDRETGLRDLIQGTFVEPGLWNKLYRREIVLGFEQSPLWRDGIRVNEDILMNYILFSRAQKSVYEDIPYYHYILRKGSAATSQGKLYQVQDPQTVMSLILSDIPRDSSLYPSAFERYLRTLMGAARQTAWPEEAVKARKLLKSYALKAFGVRNMSAKFKGMVFGETYLAPVYHLVRRVYEKYTGIDKKYSLE